MTVKADPAQLHYLQQISHPFSQSPEPILLLQRRTLSAIGITLVLLILTYTLEVLSVRGTVATSTDLPTGGLLNLISTLVTLLTNGAAELPLYDISQDRRVGSRRLTLAPTERIVVAEGIFAAHLIRSCQEAGLLADAICLTHRPAVTFWRRLVRDVRENRKGALTLLRRGRALLAAEPGIVAEQVSLGAEPVHGADALQRLQRVMCEAPSIDAVEQRAPGEAAA